MKTRKKPTYKELEKENIALKEKADFLTFLTEQYKRMIFGRKSERFVDQENPDQLKLGFDEREEQSDLEKTTVREIVETYTRKKTTTKLKPSRQPLPEHLPREIVIIEPLEDVTGWKKIGEEITEVLDYIPGKFKVIRYVRPKYLNPSTKGEKSIITTGSLPSRPIEKGIPSVQLLVYILIGKFVDHMPYYRLIEKFKRVNVRISASTINDWIAKCCVLLKVVYDLHCFLQFKSSYLQGDETTIKVLEKRKSKSRQGKKTKSHTGYFWVYSDPRTKQVVFHYEAGRGAKYPFKHLENFKGKLQTDAYKVYDILDKFDHIEIIGCLAHVRRKFEQALGNDGKRARHAMLQIQALYAIEAEARELGYDAGQRKTLRQQKSKPVMDALKIWLEESKQGGEVLPKSAIGVAIQHALNRWKYIYKYLEDGNLEIDNNFVENVIRPAAVGRKNYLFAGSSQGAEWAAIIYTLLTSAAKLGHNPQEYLLDILTRLPDHPINEIEKLLPIFWKKDSGV